MHLCLLSHSFFSVLVIARLKLASLVDFFFVHSEMCTDDCGQNDQNNKATALHFVLEAKRATYILLERMRKSLDFVPRRRIWINYWTIFLHSGMLYTIVKYVRNAGKNIQHSLVSSNFHKPLPKYKSY